MAKGTAAENTKTRIVDEALRISTRAGLGLLSFGGLAEVVGMSKSGLFAHFGSKDGLMIACVDEAERRFVAAVVASEEPPGILRTRGIIDRYVAYCAGVLVDDGAFLSTVVREVEGLPQRVYERVQLFARRWQDTIRAELGRCVEANHLRTDVDADTFVLAVLGFGLATSWFAALEGNRHAVRDRSVRNVSVMLHELATDEGRRALG